MHIISLKYVSLCKILRKISEVRSKIAIVGDQGLG